MDLTKNALWIFGDSFCTESTHPDRWTEILLQYFQSKYESRFATRYYNYAQGSMDTQTIIDNWIKALPHMHEDDAIVVCTSDISRTRFPLKPNFVHTLPFQPNPNNAPELNSYFMYGPVGWDPTNCQIAINNTDVPFTNQEDFGNHSRAQNYILNANSYNKSKIDIIEALYKLTPCKHKFVYTWVDWDILKSDYIYSKEWVNQNVMGGKWESLHQEWVRTNGKSGIEHDGHLSGDSEKMMADYFIKEFEL
jgi:hypothetical protein